jgi:hypothetical protein
MREQVVAVQRRFNAVFSPYDHQRRPNPRQDNAELEDHTADVELRGVLRGVLFYLPGHSLHL